MKILYLLPRLSWWFTSKLVKKDAKLIKDLADNYSFTELQNQLLHYEHENKWETRYSIFLMDTQIILKEKAKRYSIIYTLFLFLIPQVVIHSIRFIIEFIITLL